MELCAQTFSEIDYIESLMNCLKFRSSVIPAKAGIQKLQHLLDPGC
ncbi:hypothetical protein D3OALGB2SA_4401 [Olavius algarvensis associated proteobacterium Delta 3]|nr:hypothetical protein D3OALGB2SA_4401 [Olavius algarvensis associated proteobacterium Delta 3]